MSKADCTLSILVARTDTRFMPFTIPHLVRMCRVEFNERVLLVDLSPLRSDYLNRPGIGTTEQLLDICEQLKSDGWIDRIQPIDYDPQRRLRLYQQHFGRNLRWTHDGRGYPILGILFSIEDAQSDNLLHFDSDILMHQAKDHDWVNQGIRLLAAEADVMTVSPRPGPPAANGQLKQPNIKYELDDRGFFRFKSFTSRRFLVNRHRLGEMLPLVARSWSQRRALLNRLLGKNDLVPWEMMISDGLARSRFIRADLASDKAWTLHTPDHGEEFIRRLPEIIEQVELGHYPVEQSGEYDLRLSLWP